MISLSKWWHWFIALVVLIAVFIGGFYFQTLVSERLTYEGTGIKTSEQVSVAVDDRSRLVIIDMTTGKVQIFTKEVLDALYYESSARKSYTHEDQKP